MNSFTYQPLSAEEAERARQYPLLQDGIYTFSVVKATLKQSSKGNSMIELQEVYWNDEGKEFIVFDFLIGIKSMEWKTRHFCEAVGLEKEYISGKFNENLCLGKQGKASIILQKGKANANGGFYKDKNVVEDYIASKNDNVYSTSPNISTNEKFIDSEIPF
jgi:hypothetical protein